MKSYIVVILTLLNTLASLAQEVSFTASTQKVVSVGEQFRLAYQVNKQGKNFQVDAMPGFRILSGPNVSNSSSVTIVNGQVTKNITQSYNYVLQASKEGKFTIPAAKIVVDNKTYQSNALSIEVVKQRSNTSQNNSDDTQIDSKDLYLEISSNHRNVYLGEPISVTLKIFSRVNLADLQNAEFPEYKGFYSQEIKTEDNISLQRENINGTIYNTAVLDKVLLYPQKTGEITIENAKIDAIVQKQVQRSGRRNVFDSMFGGGYKNYRVPLKSNKLKINVKALPTNEPNGFSGAVGQFSVTAEVDNTELKANDALTYKISISGNGNIKLLEDPKIEFPHDFDVWEPSINNKIKNTSSGSKGTKIYEYVIQPRHPGNFKIPKFQFAYFDPNTKKYKTIETESFDITVSQGDRQLAVVNSAGLSKEDVELIGKDIRYIKTGSLLLSSPTEPIFGTLTYWLSFIAGIIIFILIFILRRKQIKQASNSALMKNKKAKKEAIKRLKVAKEHLKNDVAEKFYEEIIKGLQGYLSDKLNIAFADLNLEIAILELEKRGFKSDILSQLKDIMLDCEIARYAPSQTTKNKNDIYNISLNLISAFENGIKADLKTQKN